VIVHVSHWDPILGYMMELVCQSAFQYQDTLWDQLARVHSEIRIHDGIVSGRDPISGYMMESVSLSAF
jgi:hypothetical protein